MQFSVEFRSRLEKIQAFSDFSSTCGKSKIQIERRNEKSRPALLVNRYLTAFQHPGQYVTAGHRFVRYCPALALRYTGVIFLVETGLAK
jgi:hypothetical protein